MILSSLSVLYVALLLAATISKLRRGSELDMLPSICWAAFMLLPFMGQRYTFSPEFAAVQSFGVFLFGFVLLAGDAWSEKLGWLRFHKRDAGGATGAPPAGGQPLSERDSLRIGYLLFGVIVLLQLTHLFLMPEIPFLHRFSGPELSDAAASMLRERSSKLLHVPRVLIYAFQVSFEVLAPLALLILAQQRRWLLAGFLFLLSAFYSRSTNAKGPLLVFLILCAAVFYVQLSLRWRRRVLIGAAAVSVPLCLWSGFLLWTHERSPLVYKAAKELDPVLQAVASDERLNPFTLADHCRCSAAYRKLPDIDPVTKTLFSNFYRIFLGPSDVSQRWYIYYPEVNGGYLGWYGLTPATRYAADFEHPANTIGKWAYVRRFPRNYFSTAHAYASVDADAWARWGYTGLLVTAALVLLLRMACEGFRLQGSLGEAVHAGALVSLGLNLPAASLLATLFAHGAIIFIGLPVAVLAAAWLRAKLRRASNCPATLS